LNAKLVSGIAAAALSRLRTVCSGASVREVAQSLSSTHISLVVVCDPQGTMLGVVTKTDIVRRIGLCTGQTCTDTVDEVMTRDVVSCQATDGLPHVLAMMQSRGLVHVPVVDPGGKPSGVVNARDALRELMLEGQYEEALLRDYVMGVGYR
jgi:signal-transduction protein with cAMP-binding, CBS, and nucleotidyltransferase domain